MSAATPPPTEPTDVSEVTAADIGSVIGALLGAARDESTAAFLKATELPEVSRAVSEALDGDCDGFYFALMYPVEQAVRGLANFVVPGSDKAAFLLCHGRFVETQFRAVIEKYEGTACGADKTGFLVDSLLEFFKSGREVVLDREQRYTYHLPTKVFLTHADVLAFFEAVYSLYYGRSAPFVGILASIDANVAR